MSEIVLTPTQIEDSLASFDGAKDAAFANSDMQQQHFQPETVDVPRPNFNAFATVIGAIQDQSKMPRAVNGRLRLEEEHRWTYAEYPGLRGLATVISGSKKVRGPAIVLPDGKSLVMLTAETIKTELSGQGGTLREVITPMQHGLLDVEYLKAAAQQPAAEHDHDDFTNAAAMAPALVLVTGRGNVHEQVHTLSTTIRDPRSFGTKLTSAGRQDFAVGAQTRKVHSAVLESNFVFDVAPYDQSEEYTLGPNRSGYEIAVGTALSAAVSLDPLQARRISDNMRNMVSA